PGSPGTATPPAPAPPRRRCGSTPGSVPSGWPSAATAPAPAPRRRPRGRGFLERAPPGACISVDDAEVRHDRTVVPWVEAGPGPRVPRADHRGPGGGGAREGGGERPWLPRRHDHRLLVAAPRLDRQDGPDLDPPAPPVRAGPRHLGRLGGCRATG